MDKQEALEVVRKNWPNGRHQITEALKTLIPELTEESEDGRIRKYLMDVVNDYCKGSEYEGCIAWLEKQGEQKPEIKYIYPKFRVGDVIEPAKPNGYCPPVRVKYIGDFSYSCESDDHKSFLSLPICNENEYVLTGQKSAWSEEDERMLKSIIATCELAEQDRDSSPARHLFEMQANWLKSLKEKYTWKPSVAQMKALQCFLEHGCAAPDKEASRIALACGQITKLHYWKDKLDSSDIFD